MRQLRRGSDHTAQHPGIYGYPPGGGQARPGGGRAARSNDFRCTVVATGQHKEMFRQVASTFGFEVDADLDVMRPNQTLSELTARLMDGIAGWLRRPRQKWR